MTLNGCTALGGRDFNLKVEDGQLYPWGVCISWITTRRWTVTYIVVGGCRQFAEVAQQATCFCSGLCWWWCNTCLW